MPEETTPYRYDGFLSRILREPDPSDFAQLDAIEFSAAELHQWKTEDLSHATEWRKVPGRRVNNTDCVQLEGDFTNVTAIDALSPNDPRYWVPLSSLGINDERFPIDTTKYPVIEVTYRCTSPNAHPTWMWTYPGGSHFGALPKERHWVTVARIMPWENFPESISDVVFRLYSGTRSVESFEIQKLRFRELSKTERESVEHARVSLADEGVTKHFPTFDEFLPLGVYMDAESARRLAEMLSITLDEYLDLVMQDLVAHHCNAIFLAHTDRLDGSEWDSLLRRCRESGIRIVPRHDYPLDGTPEDQEKFLERYVSSNRDAPEILARSLSGEPIENDFFKVLEARKRFETADPNHPVCLMARYPNAYPLFAPFFSISGIGHFHSRRPWDMGTMVREHVSRCGAQQFWVSAPAFQYPTQTPEWSTCPEMRVMFNSAFANGARGWFAYSYHNDPVWLRGRVQRTLTGPFLMFSDLWEETSQRMRSANALSPLLLASEIQDSVEDWFRDAAHVETALEEPAPGIEPISTRHLAGDEFSLYFAVSNNIRDIASVNIKLPKDVGAGRRVFDLTEYLHTQEWEVMPRERHVEMFPGHAHVLLVASSERGEELRDAITKRLLLSDELKMQHELRIARAYGLRTADAERGIERAKSGVTPKEFRTLHGARERLRNRIYTTDAYAEANSRIIEASSAICGCDGALCRLMTQGKSERAVFLGREVVPLAAEITHLRLELIRGQGKSIRQPAEALAYRARHLLTRIRAEYTS